MIMDRSPLAKEYNMVYRPRPEPSLRPWDISMLAYLLSDVVEYQREDVFCTSTRSKFFPYMGSIQLRINNDLRTLHRSPKATRHVAIRIAVQLALWDIANPEQPYWSLKSTIQVLQNMVIDYSDSTSYIQGKASTRDYDGTEYLSAMFLYATERAHEIKQTLVSASLVRFTPHMGPISKRSYNAAFRKSIAINEEREACTIHALPQSPHVNTTSAPLLTLSDLTMTPDVRRLQEQAQTDRSTVTFHLGEQPASGVSQQLFASPGGHQGHPPVTPGPYASSMATATPNTQNDSELLRLLRASTERANRQIGRAHV